MTAKLAKPSSPAGSQNLDASKYTGDKKSNRETREIVRLLRNDKANHSRRKIAEIAGVSPQRISRICAQIGRPFGRLGATRQIHFRTGTRKANALEELAAKEGLSLGAYMDRWAKVITDDPIGATRFMGKLAKGAR